MGSAVELRTDDSASDLRRLARASQERDSSVGYFRWRRCLTVRAERMPPGSAGWIAPDRARLGASLQRSRAGGTQGRLLWWSRAAAFAKQLSELARDCRNRSPTLPLMVRRRRVDLQKVIKERFGVDYYERHVSTPFEDAALPRLNCSWMLTRCLI